MKTKNLLFLLMILPNIIFAQDYCPFDFENGLWEAEYYSAFNSSYYISSRSHYNEYTVGDTLVNDSLLCYKLLRKGVLCDEYSDFSCIENQYTPFTQDMGLICEQEKKVYFNNNLLYDFNVEVGDTIEHWLGVQGGINNYPIVTIVNIDSVEMCGKIRRRFQASNFTPGETYFIEGIGSTSGLLPAYQDQLDGSTLMCYSDQNCAPCPIIVDVDEVSQSHIKVYPNPFKENIFIDTEMVDYQITIFNQNGQTIKTFQNESNLELAELPSGVYFLGIHFDNNIEYQKIVKYE